MNLTIWPELVYNSTFIKESHILLHQAEMNFIIQVLCEFFQQFWHIFVIPTCCSWTLYFTCFIDRTNVRMHNVEVLHTDSFSSTQVGYISYNYVNPSNKTQSGNAAWFKSCSRYLLSWLDPCCLQGNPRIVPTNWQRSLPNPYLCSSRSPPDIYPKLIVLTHSLLKLYSPLCSRMNG
jgi:hypothetical protein